MPGSFSDFLRAPLRAGWLPRFLSGRCPTSLGLRSYLLGLLLLALLPALAVGGLTSARLLRDYRAARASGLLDIARALAIAIDREIDGQLSTLTALAASPELDAGPQQLGGFALHASRAAAALGSPITVIDRDLRLVLDTDRPTGGTAPRTAASEAAANAFATLRPVVSPLVTGVVNGALTVAVMVPAARPEGAAMLLATRLQPADLARLLASQALAEGVTAAVVDSRGSVVARSAEQTAWLGRSVPDWVAAALGSGPEGVARGDGGPRGALLVAHRRLDTAPGWAVTVAAPAAARPAGLFRPALAIALGGLATFGLGLFVIAGLHRRVVGPVEALRRQAERLASPGSLVPPPGPVPVAELEQLRRSLLRAAETLQARAAAECQSRKALAASERRFRRLAESGNVTLWRADPDGRVLEAPGWSLMTGQSAEALRGHGWLEAVHPKDVAAARAMMRQGREAQQPVSVEYRVRTRLGTWRWVRGRGVPVFDESGELVEWAGVVEDVDARRRAEAAMRDLVGTLDLAAVLERDLAGRIRFWSAGCERLYGWTAAEAVGATTHDLLSPLFPDPDAPDAAPDFATALARHGEWSGELRQRTRSAGEVVVLCRMVLRPGDDGRPDTVLEAIMDVTALRLAEDALRESEGRVLRALAAARVGAWEWDLATGRVTGSPGREEVLYGRPRGFMRHATDILPLTHPEDRAMVAEALRRVQRGDTADYEIEYRVLRPDGEQRWLRSLGRATANAEGAAQRVSGVSIDVTEQRAVRERERLLAREVDHRAKNALAVVHSVLRLTSMAEPRAYAAAVGARVSALSRAHSLLAQEGWGGADLRLLIERELASPRVEPGAITLEGPPLRLAATAVQPMVMVLHELASNAFRHGALSRPGGQLRVSWQPRRREGEGGTLRLRWEETGGPGLVPPAQSGFGFRVIAATVRGQLGGTLAFDWTADGMVCDITIPLARWLTDAGALHLEVGAALP